MWKNDVEGGKRPFTALGPKVCDAQMAAQIAGTVVPSQPNRKASQFDRKAATERLGIQQDIG